MERLSAWRRAEEEFGNALFALEMLYGQDADPVAAIVAAERERCAAIMDAKAARWRSLVAHWQKMNHPINRKISEVAEAECRVAAGSIRAGAP